MTFFPEINNGQSFVDRPLFFRNYLDNVRLPVPCHCEAAIAAEAISLRA